MLNAGFLTIEAVAGFATGSLALLSDAGHMLGDVAALALAWFAVRLAQTGPTPARSFGLLRARVLGALVNAASLVVVAVLVVKEALERLHSGPPAVPGLVVLAVGAAGLVVNLVSALGLRRHAHDLNTRAAYLHVLGDALGSVAAILAGLAILLFDAQWADPVVSCVVSALIVFSAWRPLKEATGVLLQFAPERVSVEELQKELASLPGVRDVHELHVWTLDGNEAIATAHLVVAPGEDPHAVRLRAERMLHERHGVTHTTLQTEDDDGGHCPQDACPAFDGRSLEEGHHGHAH